MKKDSLTRSLAPFLCAVLLLTSACQPKSPEEQLKDYNAELGPEGELTATHLIVRWPALGAEDRPVTLKIPRDYLRQEQPVVKNKAGEIEAIYITVAMPEATAWQPMTPRGSNSDPPERRAQWERHSRTRKAVIVHRDLRGGAEWRASVRRSDQAKGRSSGGYELDGTVSGLERYSRTTCRLGPNGPANQEFIDAKPADDPSAPNCRRLRAWAQLVSPPEVTANNEGVHVSCGGSSCTAYFVGGQRGMDIQLYHEEVPRWREYVEPIRKRIDSFVVE